MNEASSQSCEWTEARPIQWIRKRDGETVRFERDKLLRSLQLAARDRSGGVSPDVLTELARMSVFFLSASLAGDCIDAQEVAEGVEKSLRETGQEALARAYGEHHQRKLQARTSLVVVPDSSGESEPPHPAYWDKSRLMHSLRVRLGLDAKLARELASRVERTVLLGKFTRLTTDLVRELVNNELAVWDVPARLRPAGAVRVMTADLKHELSLPGGPAAASRLIMGKIWRDFALNEIVSADVADADQRGLLRIHSLGSPASLAAACVDCAALVRQARGPRDSLDQFGVRLAQAAESGVTLLAIDRVESWLALIAEPHDSPAQLVDQFWQQLHSRVRHSSLDCVINLCGRISEGVAAGAGPLFGDRPSAAQQACASELSQELLERFMAHAADWPGLRLDWRWGVPAESVQRDLALRIARLIVENHPVSIVFDRDPAAVAEGLRRCRDLCRPVLEYIGLSVPLVWRDAGSPRSLSALDDGLAQAIHLAVRAAVQKREFVRRIPSRIGYEIVDQAVLAVTPVGLDWTVRQVAGKSFAEDDGALRLAETLVRRLHDLAQHEARCFALPVVVDGHNRRTASTQRETSDTDETLEGLVPCAQGVGVRRQIHAAGRLHAIAQAGTLVCPRGSPSTEAAERLAETLDWAALYTQLVRLQVAPRPAASQATVSWPEP